MKKQARISSQTGVIHTIDCDYVDVKERSVVLYKRVLPRQPRHPLHAGCEVISAFFDPIAVFVTDVEASHAKEA